MKNFEVSFGENDITSMDLENVISLIRELTHNTEATTSIRWVREVMRSGIIFTIRDASPDGKKMNSCDRLVGMATLTIGKKITASFGTVEDVVIDPGFQGKGLGKELLEKVIAKARELGMSYIELTSNPKRAEANHLYEKMGFKKRETNKRRLTF